MDPIRSVYEDDPDMLEIVREFAAELPDRIVDLEGRLETGDLAQLQVLAHQLKGAGGGYGFSAVTDAAAVLEQSLKAAADAGVIKEHCGALCDTLRAVQVPEEG
jgi:HPt (histidine-containing phosphotransfer) domain-containing protein